MVKVWLQPAGILKSTPRTKPWWSPFVDLFTFIADEERIYEVSPGNKSHLNGINEAGDKHWSYSLTEYFPTRPFYMAGVYFFGPRDTIAASRYSLQRCRMTSFSHRFETFWGAESWGLFAGPDRKLNYLNNVTIRNQTLTSRNTVRLYDLDCCVMAMRFPFAHGGDTVSSGNYTMPIFPSKPATTYTVLWHVSAEQRNEWATAEESRGPELTAQVPNLDQVEVDNSIAPPGSCAAKNGRLTVVEFNAERGRYWLQALPLLRDAGA